ncbi:hypothetical protein [Ruminococcus sp.]|uniref:hypothetical protein n=1 Tax=Ruminococcus sp. TaxID=41978 RepID=UPI0025F80A74|nr:hypothetical protein [Ruminococcus sp.]
MEWAENAREFLKSRKWAVFMTICGIAGLLLIMISSLLPENDSVEKNTKDEYSKKAGEYSVFVENRLSDFLSRIDGAGEVRVYISVVSSEKYIYATEGRSSRSENKTDVEEKCVIVGSGSEKNALVETVENPRINGAVVLCSGGDSPIVCERVYNAVSAALGLPLGNIYVSKLR